MKMKMPGVQAGFREGQKTKDIDRQWTTEHMGKPLIVFTMSDCAMNIGK